MKTSDILLLAGGALALYVFMPKTKEVLAGVPGAETLQLPEIDITLPELKYPDFAVPDLGDLVKPISELTAANILSNLPEIQFPRIPESATKETKSVVGEAGTELDFDAIRQKAGVIAGTGAGAITAVGVAKYVPITTRLTTTAATRIAPRLATKGAVKIGLKAIPVVGWGYLAADVGATIYELISGKSIGGDWLGWGEAIREIF